MTAGDARPALVLLALALAAGAALRFPGLAGRPMHADEAVLADKFGTLLEGGGYRYDPSGYHGPALLYLTLPSAWLAGASTYRELSEVTLRVVTAAAGLLLIAAPFLLAGGTGWLPLGFAALFTALSPAMVYYSRYYIPEMVLTLFVFAAAGSGYRAVRSGGLAWAVLAGFAAGMALAAKETAVIAFAGLAAAAGPSLLRLKRRQTLVACAAAAGTAGLLLTSFLANPRGVWEYVRSFAGTYFRAATGGAGHVHPWYFYLQALWQAEPLLLVLAALGAVWAFRTREATHIRALARFAILAMAVYSVIRYKTPWCLLAFWQPALVLAGAAAAALLRAARGPRRVLAGATLIAIAAGMAAQSWRLSGPLSTEPGNPYVYAHTARDVFLIRQRLEDLAGSLPDRPALEVHIYTTANWWPLPWYLRSFPNLGWAREAPARLAPAGVILASPDLEPEVVRKLYEDPPPGERELYLHLFPRQVYLRPGVEVRGYVARRLVNQ